MNKYGLNKYGYCKECGTPLEVEVKWRENFSGYGPNGHYEEIPYCPECLRKEQIREQQIRERIEQERKRKKEEEERKKEEKRLERLEKYKKYMPKKVTSIVLTNQEAQHLFIVVDRELKEFQKKGEIDNDNVYVDEVLIEKLNKARFETDYTLKESYEFAKGKGWESDEKCYANIVIKK